jgi:hypothetical protein
VRDEAAVDPVAQDLLHTGNRTADNGAARSHALDQGERHALVVRAQHGDA